MPGNNTNPNKPENKPKNKPKANESAPQPQPQPQPAPQPQPQPAPQRPNNEDSGDEPRFQPRPAPPVTNEPPKAPPVTKEPPAPKAPPQPKPFVSEILCVKVMQAYAIMAKEGGYAALQDVDISKLDGARGPKTAASLEANLGMTTEELKGLTERQAMDALHAKMENDPAFAQSVLAGLEKLGPEHRDVKIFNELIDLPSNEPAEPSSDPRELQALVTALGKDIGPIDGLIGPNTIGGAKELLGPDVDFSTPKSIADAIKSLQKQLNESLSPDTLGEHSGIVHNAVLRAAGGKMDLQETNPAIIKIVSETTEVRLLEAASVDVSHGEPNVEKPKASPDDITGEFEAAHNDDTNGPEVEEGTPRIETPVAKPVIPTTGGGGSPT